MRERLFRSRTKRVFGGVAGGLSEYLNVDPVLIRVIFVIITFINGLGALLYVILWIVVPEEQTESGDTTKAEQDYVEPKPPDDVNIDNNKKIISKSSGNGRVVVGLILVGLGIVFLLERFFPYFEFMDILPLVIIAVGGALVWNTLKK